MGTALIPCILVSGYLGAGKTTLINQFLSAPNGLRAVVLVNDFEKVNIDAHLIDTKYENTIELSNGCACSSIGDSLLAAAQQAAERVARPDVIIVEASGVARSDRMATVLMRASGVAPAQIVTVVDVSQAREACEKKYIAELFLHQITVAQYLVPNRVCSDNKEILNRLRAPNGGTIPQVTELGQMMQGAVSGHAMGGGPQNPNPAAPIHSHLDSAQFVRKLVSVPDGANIDQVHDWLVNMPQYIQRAKGFAQLKGRHGQVSLHSVSKSRDSVRVQPSAAKVPSDMIGQIVVIAPRAAIDPHVRDWGVSFGDDRG